MENRDFLTTRILLQLLAAEDGQIGVTRIARVLGEEKYTISRMMSAMEKEGLINRKDSRHPTLTNFGRRTAETILDRMSVIQNHLVYEGVDSENAAHDSFYWASYSSEKTIAVIRNMEERYRIRHEFRKRRKFTGWQFCRKLRDGTYTFPFLIYRESIKNGSNISMSNEGFEHPCIIEVKDGKGQVILHATDMAGISGKTGELLTGHVNKVSYLDNGEYITAEKRLRKFTIPMDPFHFISVGSGSGQILHGSLCLKMTCSVGLEHMPESVAVFTLII